MSVLTLPLRDLFASQPASVEENKTFYKVISAVPFVGAFFSVVQELSLAEKISSNGNAHRLVELLRVKNAYKVAHVIRNVLHVAIIIAMMVFSLIPRLLGVAIILVHTALSGWYIKRIGYNQQVMGELQKTGVRSGMRFY